MNYVFFTCERKLYVRPNAAKVYEFRARFPALYGGLQFASQVASQSFNEESCILNHGPVIIYEEGVGKNMLERSKFL